MKALKLHIDMHTGETLLITTVDINSDLLNVDHEEMLDGELVYITYRNDFSPGPELEPDCDFDLY